MITIKMQPEEFLTRIHRRGAEIDKKLTERLHAEWATVKLEQAKLQKYTFGIFGDPSDENVKWIVDNTRRSIAFNCYMGHWQSMFDKYVNFVKMAESSTELVEVTDDMSWWIS